MKKAFALLALSLVALPLLAINNHSVGYAGYRIGDSNVMSDSVRIFRIDAEGNEQELPYTVTDASQDQGLSLVASTVIGQKLIGWWAYSSASRVPQSQAIVNGSIVITPASTNYNGKTTIATGGYSLTWTYNTVGYTPAYLVVDYDYIKYNLSYDANGGSGAPSAVNNIIYTNEVVIASGNGLSRTGYTWSGWTNDLTTTVWTNGETVTGSSLGLNSIVDGSNVVLRAKWTPNIYTVTLDPCEGTVDPESVSVTYDAAWPALPTPTRDGYYFDGWYNDDHYNTATPTNSTVAITQDVTIYAKWTQLLTATFIDPIDSNTQLVYVAYGSTPTAPFTPIHPGFTFSDWSPKLGNIYEDRIYTAQFTGTQYFITYHSNFGNPEEARKIDYVYGTAKAALDGETEFPRAGYTFDGWATSANSNQIRFHAGEDIVTFSMEGDALYAVWKPIDYWIHFDANGGEGEMDDVSVKYGEAYTVTNCTFTKTGVSFVGWATNVANGAEFYVDDSVSNLTTTANATVTFYAVWSEPRYIAFDGNGADNPDAMVGDEMTFEGVETRTLVPNEFEKTGYTFIGWATNATTAVAYTNCADVVSTNLWMAIGETNVLYAAWRANKYSVVFNPNGGTGSMDDQVFYYDQEQQLTKCTFGSSLMFGGWATNETGVAVFKDEAMVTNLTSEAGGAVELYATWDNGKLSKAMHCDNLVWMQDDSSVGQADWEACTGDGKGYNPSDSSPSGSSVCAILPNSKYQTYVMQPSGASGGGQLSFWYKMSSQDANQCWLSFSKNATSGLKIDPETDWAQYGPVEIEHIENVKLIFVISDNYSPEASYTVWIDQMTWIPAGQEPTDEDRPTISGLTRTTDGFALSVDQTNISDNFSYQILSTNELVNGDWPVMETLTADELKAGYSIAIEENEPKMFYKVRVISK